MIGKLLNNRYEVIRLIGTGGMADVYLAKCSQLGRKVAIKVLKNTEDEFAKETFIRESKAIAKLSHPNIVQVYDFFEEDGKQCIVMEYIQGESLKTLIKNENKIFTEQEVLEIGLKLSKALDHAHINGVVHSDIKPDNIIIDQYLEPRITDFGIAKLISDESHQTKQLYGSPRYSSPEQVQGKVIDERTDVYSLGVVLYELANNKMPFPADTDEVINFKLSNLPIVNPKNINPELSDAFNELLNRCLYSDKLDRYASMRYISDEISKILEDNKIEDTIDKKINKIPKNNKVALVAIGTAIFGLVISLLVMFYLDNSKVKIPNVELKKFDVAKKIMEEQGLKIEIERKEASKDLDQNVVISQSKKDVSVSKGTIIRVVVSENKKETMLPNFVNMNYKEAVDKAKEIGIKIGKIDFKESSDVAKDSVVSQDPKEGTEINDDIMLNLVVNSDKSKSENSMVMPDIVGKSVDDSIKELNEIGLYVNNITLKTSKKYDENIVISSSIKENESIELNQGVDLVVSQGELIKDGDSVDKTISVDLNDFNSKDIIFKVEYINESEKKQVSSKVENVSGNKYKIQFTAPKGSLYNIYADEIKIKQGLVD